MHRLDPDGRHRGREPARLADHLPDEREIVAVDRAPGRVVRGGGQRPDDLARVDDVAHFKRSIGRQAPHVLREPPELLVGQELLVDQIGERRHRRGVEPRPQAAVNIPDRGAAPEPPVLVQVRREDWLAGVVVEVRGRRPVPPPLLTVTLEAVDRVVELAPDPQRLGAAAAAGLAREREHLHVLARVGEERRERLEIRHHVATIARRQPRLPRRHRRPGKPLVDGAHQVRVGGQLSAGRRADLVDRAGEVARPRQHVVRRFALAVSLIAVTSRAPFYVNHFASGCILGGQAVGYSGGQKSGGQHHETDRQTARPPDPPVHFAPPAGSAFSHGDVGAIPVRNSSQQTRHR